MQTHLDASAVYAKIESLDMSPAMKEAMRFIHDHCLGMHFGVPAYDVKGWRS